MEECNNPCKPEPIIELRFWYIEYRVEFTPIKGIASLQAPTEHMAEMTFMHDSQMMSYGNRIKISVLREIPQSIESALLCEKYWEENNG